MSYLSGGSQGSVVIFALFGRLATGVRWFIHTQLLACGRCVGPSQLGGVVSGVSGAVVFWLNGVAVGFKPQNQRSGVLGVPAMGAGAAAGAAAWSVLMLLCVVWFWALPADCAQASCRLVAVCGDAALRTSCEETSQEQQFSLLCVRGWLVH